MNKKIFFAVRKELKKIIDYGKTLRRLFTSHSNKKKELS